MVGKIARIHEKREIGLAELGRPKIQGGEQMLKVLPAHPWKKIRPLDGFSAVRGGVCNNGPVDDQKYQGDQE